jgi:hypothetical protein
LHKGINHKSPFAKKVFNLIFWNPQSGGVVTHSFDTDEYKQFFWQSSFTINSVQLVNQERNTYASFVRTSVDLSLAPPNSSLINLLNDLCKEVEDNDSLPEDMSSRNHQFIIAALELYSLALFGRQDPDAWLQCFLPIVATITKYRKGASTPNSKKEPAKFWDAVNKINRELSGRTVSQLIHIVDESLIRLFIIKHVISSIFKDHLDILTLLLKL